MKHLFTLLIIIAVCGSSSVAQNYIFRYNPYSGMNKDQLVLALEQANRMERNGKTWTAVGAGMMAAGGYMTFKGIKDLSIEETDNYGSFAAGIGILCASAFPLGYGLIAWLSGSERSNMIEIELLSSDFDNLSLQPTGNGVGLVLTF